MLIRAETPDDHAAVSAVNLSAFDTPAESKLVNVLRTEVRPLISLVAEVDGTILGHIMLSPTAPIY